MSEDRSYLPWTTQEIQSLDKLYRNDLTLDQISKVLGRSPRSVEYALKNLLVQELIHSNPRRVSSKYNVSYETLESELAPYKYNIQEDTNQRFLVVVGIIVMYVLVTAIGFMLT